MNETDIGERYFITTPQGPLHTHKAGDVLKIVAHFVEHPYNWDCYLQIAGKDAINLLEHLPEQARLSLFTIKSLVKAAEEHHLVEPIFRVVEALPQDGQAEVLSCKTHTWKFVENGLGQRVLALINPMETANQKRVIETLEHIYPGDRLAEKGLKQAVDDMKAKWAEAEGSPIRRALGQLSQFKFDDRGFAG